MHSNRFMGTQLMKITFQSLLYVFLFLSFFSALSITNPQIINISRTAATTMATFAIIMSILTFVYGGYDIGNKKPRSVFSSILIVTLLADIITYFQLQIMNVNPEKNATLLLFGEDFALFCGAVFMQIGLIYFFTTLGYYLYFKINPPQRCCIVTSSQELAAHVAEKMATFPKKFHLCDVVHYDCPDVEKAIEAYDAIFLAGIPDTEEAHLENVCYRQNKTIYLLAELEDVIISSAQQNILEDAAFLYIHRVELTLVQRFVKRFFDILISVLGLVVFSPLMLIAAVCILLFEGKPVFFRQKRATLNGKVFEIVKFRTMYQDQGRQTEFSARKDDRRIMPLGRILRKYRIDEIPQLYNVFLGDMSIVGPRPEMLENVTKYEQEVPEFKYRQQMKAGLTGLAQIDGKYNTSPKDKAILDLMYIENFTLAMDLKLMLRTLTVFFRRDSTEGFGGKRTACPKMRTAALARESAPEAEKPAARPRTPPRKPSSKAASKGGAQQSPFRQPAVSMEAAAAGSAAPSPAAQSPVLSKAQEKPETSGEEAIRAAL